MIIYCTTRMNTAQDIHDFAVGNSHKPLPNGIRFAIVTNTGFRSIKATDADARFCLDPIEASAKLLPAAILSEAENNFTTRRTVVGSRTITNGVKQQRSVVRSPGGGLPKTGSG